MFYSNRIILCHKLYSGKNLTINKNEKCQHRRILQLLRRAYSKYNQTGDVLAMSSRSASSNITASSCSVGTRCIVPGDSSLPSRRRCEGSSWVLVELRRVFALVLTLQTYATQLPQNYTIYKITKCRKNNFYLIERYTFAFKQRTVTANVLHRSSTVNTF